MAWLGEGHVEVAPVSVATAAHRVVLGLCVDHALSLSAQGGCGGGRGGTLLCDEGVSPFGVLAVGSLASPVLGLGTRAGCKTTTTVGCVRARKGLTGWSVCWEGGVGGEGGVGREGR